MRAAEGGQTADESGRSSGRWAALLNSQRRHEQTSRRASCALPREPVDMTASLTTVDFKGGRAILLRQRKHQRDGLGHPFRFATSSRSREGK
jgi:hypothetical protein